MLSIHSFQGCVGAGVYPGTSGPGQATTVPEGVTEQTAISFTVLEVTQAQDEDANTERAHLAGGFKLCTLFLCLKRSSRSLLL